MILSQLFGLQTQTFGVAEKPARFRSLLLTPQALQSFARQLGHLRQGMFTHINHSFGACHKKCPLFDELHHSFKGSGMVAGKCA
jgi:hypothetical protein